MTKSSPQRIVSGLVAVCATGLVLVSPARAQFASQNVELKSWLNLSQLGGAASGNDCWGYTSGSGREYALMGISNAMVVVEVTDPASPVVIGSIPHTDTLWGDVKTYLTYAYVVNDNGGGGMDVIDLSDVDNGNVTKIQSLTVGGLSTSHNVAINTDSGYLYLCGGNIASGRLVAYDLADPADPVQVGSVNSLWGTYVHDAQIVTYTSGPNAGKEIAFCANGATGLDIYDVTAKGNMFRLSRSTYPNLSYAHQCWLSDDKQYLYLNDETDGVNETHIFHVTDLSNPVHVTSYDSGVGATDHNVYVHNGYIFEAEYHAGVRIFCLEDPVAPVQTGWFDTYPENDGSGFDGAWSVYPFFPSGTLLVSDIDRGLFVLDPSEALTAGSLVVDYPNGRPTMVAPGGGTTLQVDVNGSCGATVAAGTAMFHYDLGSGFIAVPMNEIGGSVFEATFPAADCGSVIEYYVSVQSEGGATVTDPAGAPAAAYTAIAASGEAVLLADNFETDEGWTPANLGATSGDWQRGVPVDDPDWPYDPASDADGSGQCWVTQNQVGNTDVDDGAVQLTSPMLDLSAGNVTISYDYYLNLTLEQGTDMLLVEISSDGDLGPWTEIARHDTTGGTSWRHHEIAPSELIDAGVTLTSTMSIRFTANDATDQSIVEAGLDAFQLNQLECDSVPGDTNGDGIVGIDDFLFLLGNWGPCAEPCPPSCTADFDGDCTVGIGDFLILLGNWTI